MISRLRQLRRPRASPDALLNEGLELAMDWGSEWLSPINSRLLKLHPYLSAGELEELNSTCQGATQLARETIHRALKDSATTPSVAVLSPAIHRRYPWVDQRNLERLLRHGVYYAAKAGGHARDP